MSNDLLENTTLQSQLDYTAFLERLEILGLQKIINKKYNTDIEYQKAMAAALRRITFAYLQGNLTDKQGKLIEDTPVIKEARLSIDTVSLDDDKEQEKAHISKSASRLDDYIKKQSPSGVWARDIDLAILADLLHVNFSAVNDTTRKRGRGERMAISDQNPTKPCVVLCLNDKNTHWKAVINSKETDTIGDGNCGYNAFALAIKHLAQPKLALHDNIDKLQVSVDDLTASASLLPAVMLTEDERQAVLAAQKDAERRYLSGKKSEAGHASEKMIPVTSTPKEQIQADENLAWEVAVEEWKNMKPLEGTSVIGKNQFFKGKERPEEVKAEALRRQL